MRHTLELTPRLRTAADLVPAGARLADIGTDHAYLPAALLLEGKIPYAIAADLRHGPLLRARETAAEDGCRDKKGFRLCDGLKGIRPEETDAIVIAGISATIFSMATGITGWNVSDIESLLTLASTSGVQVGGLLFSGLLISSLGAVMDVAMSIGSAIAEIHAQNPALSRGELFKAGMHVGRDMMGTDSNTLILAFAGGSISMLVLDYAYSLPYQQIINSNNIGIAIMQGLSGSFGVVLSVPITVAAGAVLYTMKNRRGGTPAKEGRMEEAHIEEAHIEEAAEKMSRNL